MNKTSGIFQWRKMDVQIGLILSRWVCRARLWIKTKITTHAVTFDAKEKQTLCRRFAECFDALGAQRLLDHTTLLHYRNLLEVGLKRAIGCMLREWTAVAEGGCFTAGVTFSHVRYPFSTMIPMLAQSVSKGNASFQRHGILPYNATLFKIRC